MTRVSEKHTPPEKRTLGTISMTNTESGAGERFLVEDCRAKALTKGVFLFADTGMVKIDICMIMMQHTSE